MKANQTRRAHRAHNHYTMGDTGYDYRSVRILSKFSRILLGSGESLSELEIKDLEETIAGYKVGLPARKYLDPPSEAKRSNHE